MMFTNFSLVCLLFFLAAQISIAQPQIGSSVTPEMRQAADKSYQAKNWHEAADHYREIVKREEKNAGARYRFGISLLGIEKNQEALDQLQIANSISPNPVFAFALARAYARLLNKVKMYEVLETILKMGGVSPESIEAEPDFKNVRSETRFVEFVKKCDLAFNPCRAKPEYRQFDFWIGEWDAKNPQGLTVGSSSIQLILGECIIFENWTTPVSSGKSFNIFNSKDQKWHQTWVNDKGTFAHYVGEFKDGKMVLTAENIVNGVKSLARMTFSKLPNGDVRQFGENSVDEGKTWTTSFDLTYSRRN